MRTWPFCCTHLGKPYCQTIHTEVGQYGIHSVHERKYKFSCKYQKDTKYFHFLTVLLRMVTTHKYFPLELRICISGEINNIAVSKVPNL